MTAADGTVIGTTKIVDNGSTEFRYNLVILGDGYQESELAKYQNDVQTFLSAFQTTSPIDEFLTSFNVFRVDIASTDSGADDPTSCSGGTGAVANTYLDASFCNSGIRRLLLVDNDLAISTAASAVPEFHKILVFVNSTIPGGSGNGLGVLSTQGDFANRALHELGHSAFHLADEYEYWQGCGVDAAGTQDVHPTVPDDLVEPNVTTRPDRHELKWADLVEPTTPLPTTENADCSVCDPQASPVPPGTVGAFEGAHYHHCGAYRPEFNCKMRSSPQPFCAVCKRQIRRVLTPYQPTFVPKGLRELVNGVAGSLVLEAGLVPHFTGNVSNPSAWVDSVSPDSGTEVHWGSTVTMGLSEGLIP